MDFVCCMSFESGHVICERIVHSKQMKNLHSSEIVFFFTNRRKLNVDCVDEPRHFKLHKWKGDRIRCVLTLRVLLYDFINCRTVARFFDIERSFWMTNAAKNIKVTSREPYIFQQLEYLLSFIHQTVYFVRQFPFTENSLPASAVYFASNYLTYATIWCLVFIADQSNFHMSKLFVCSNAFACGIFTEILN